MNNHGDSEKIIGLLEKSAPQTPAGLERRIIDAGIERLLVEKKGHGFRLFYYAAAAVLLLAMTIVFVSKGRFVVQEQAKRKCGECWRFVGFDAGNSRRSSSDFCVPTALVWQTAVQNPNGAYKPLGWKGLIIVGTGTSREGSLIAINAENGETRWKRDFTSGDFYKSRRFPDRCIINQRFYITDGSQCLVMDPLSGKTLKTLLPPEPALGWSYLSAEGNRLYGGTHDGRQIFCVDAGNGKPLWTHGLQAPAFIPALSQGKLFVHTSEGEVMALNTTDGSTAWRLENTGVAGRSSIHVRDGLLAILTQNDDLALFSSKNGKALWKAHEEGLSNASLALGDDAVYVKGGNEALSLDNGKTLWNNAGNPISSCSPPTLLKSKLISMSNFGLRDLNIMDLSGRTVGSLKVMDRHVCDGAIVLNGKVFTVGAEKIAAFGCAKGG